MQAASGQAQQFVQPIPPPPPQTGERGQYVVEGFLHASASFAEDPAAARAYLAPSVKWHPSGSVTIVSPNPTFGLATRVPPSVSGQSNVQQLVVTGQRIATINGSGQYSYQPDASTKFTFWLARFGSRLLITQLPANAPLLLTESDFQEVFQPHNLYFYAPGGYSTGALIPDPVYAPVQGPNSALSTTVASSLVNALINDRRSWLGGPTSTEFPAGTTLLRPVTISNQTALVDLGGKAATANQGQVDLMYAQLIYTLTGSAYSPAIATNVELAIDGKVVPKPQSPAGSTSLVPVLGSAVGRQSSAVGRQKGSALYLASDGVVKQLEPRNRTIAPRELQRLDSLAGITALAVSAPGSTQRAAVAVPYSSGCAVDIYAPNETKYDSHPMSVTGGPCTSLSWDNTQSLWAVTGSGISVLQVGSTSPVPVSAPTQLPSGSKVLALRMAPDAVRAALLVQTGSRTQLYIAAVKFGNKGVSFGPAVPVGTDLAGVKAGPGRTGVTAMAWYDPYFLLAVRGSQVYQVPLTGGPLANGQSVVWTTSALPPGVQSITAAGQELAVGTASGTVYTSTAPYISWTPVEGNASQPTFAG
jgi:hypothetical protein